MNSSELSPTKPSKWSRLSRAAKIFIIGFFVGIVSGIAAMSCTGCGGDVITSERDAHIVVMPKILDAAPSQSDLMPENVDPVRACYDIARTLGEKELSCSGDSVKADKFQADLEMMWDCPSIIGLRDAVEFYTACLPAIKALSCADLQSANVPSSCKAQLV
jgi:hypothetical protein